MYGSDYGYRSGQINQWSIIFLKAKYLESIYPLSAGDSILDIGCNDGTTLSSFKTPISIELVLTQLRKIFRISRIRY